MYVQNVEKRHLPPLESLISGVEGETIIVTGPTSGIGRETAANLALAGAKVVLACRDVSRGEKVARYIREKCSARGSAEPVLEVAELDVLSFASIHTFAARWLASGRPLDGIVNNAGMSNRGTKVPVLTPDGHEEHWMCNYLGPYLLTLLLLPSLERASETRGIAARVVNVSSLFYIYGRLKKDDINLLEGGYTPPNAYSQSKLAQLLFSAELTRLTGGRVVSTPVFPGFIYTNLPRKTSWLQGFIWNHVLRIVLLKPEVGCRSSLAAVGKRVAPGDQAVLEAEPTALNWNGKPKSLEPKALDTADATWLWERSWRDAGLEDYPGVEVIRELLGARRRGVLT